ncbi:MAG: nucleotidyltransferase family protein [Aliiglaciecola sp.]|uniref:nucleotidyltransferase family protein n=1 Tax=Aliiglaciecola sp. TaxID=1872441 RepID=UPI00329825BA
MKLVSLILAAGEASRFGSIKQLALTQGQPMLNRVIEQHRGAGLEKVVVVLGANAELIKQQIDPSVDVVTAQNWRLGMGESIRAGVDFILHQRYPDASHIMIALADQIAVESLQIATLYKHIIHNLESIIASEYAGNVGVPACFPKRIFSDLLNLNSSNSDLQKGAKSILRANQQNLIKVKVPEAQFDIDTIEDMRRWRNSFTG